MEDKKNAVSWDLELNLQLRLPSFILKNTLYLNLTILNNSIIHENMYT